METNNCNLCPRGCFVDRAKKKTSYCGKTDEIRLALPVVYNSSGYERVESLRLLEGLIDIYLPELK